MKKILLLSIIILYDVSFVYADYIITKDKMIITGKIVKTTKNLIYIRRGKGKTKQLLKIKRKDVFSINVDSSDPVAKDGIIYNDKKQTSGEEKEKKNVIAKDRDKHQKKLPIPLYVSLNYNYNFGTVGEYLPHTIELSLNSHIDLHGRLFDSKTYILDVISFDGLSISQSCLNITQV